MKFVASIILLATAIAQGAKADDNKGDKAPLFLAYYGMVSHVLKHDQGCFNELMDNPQMENVSNFWWGYILKECDSNMANQIDRLARQSSNSPKTESSDSELRTRVENLREQCATSVIFDNWDRINMTIMANPVEECRGKKK